ncbi:MAG TPA: hypothetical protein VGN00_13035 [Puia sp.]|jgi:hypothetical protein
MSTSTTTNGLWSVTADNLKLSANQLDSPTKYSMDLTFTQQGTNQINKSNVAMKGGSKVPGGPGFVFDTTDVRIYKLSDTPTVESIKMTQPAALTGMSTVEIQLLVNSRVPEDRGFTNEEKLAMRMFDLSGSSNISLLESIKMAAEFVGDQTRLTIAFPFKVF